MFQKVPKILDAVSVDYLLQYHLKPFRKFIVARRHFEGQIRGSTCRPNPYPAPKTSPVGLKKKTIVTTSIVTLLKYHPTLRLLFHPYQCTKRGESHLVATKNSGLIPRSSSYRTPTTSRLLVRIAPRHTSLQGDYSQHLSVVSPTNLQLSLQSLQSRD